MERKLHYAKVNDNQLSGHITRDIDMYWACSRDIHEIIAPKQLSVAAQPRDRVRKEL